ncbi:GNAT family N-acetyltransferase [Rhizobium glycinendophyticum]|uniref:GNAT family N-acetyltransferase n=1 Tax=Rhizobium glycinendophyticum TaxID=2589807 RepID=A0A504UWJ1_9HYPH|nr:GNAT family N-acetyltransferase [Rhizobium glycinendophyticum]TPP09542.1 GNAT family N-acetyltransferase [Rhizobium glycinendophyticum]
MSVSAAVIRDATAADETAWRNLWGQYLTFYKVDLPDDVTAHTWTRILDASSRVSMRVAEVDGVLAGFAIHHFHDSTWVKTPDCYLEDLFLNAAFRGRGIGRALIDDLIAISKARGWSRLYWHTDRGNETARKLYDTYAPEDGHVRYRLKFG